MRPGVRLGVDVGAVRVGLAVSDPDGLVATPAGTLTRESRTGADLNEIAAQARRRGAIEVVVGLPKSLSGADGVAAERARDYAGALKRALDGVPVRLWDERMTTVDAHRQLRDSGVASRRHRDSVDQAAAVLILQAALDAERSTGSPGGEVLTGRKPRRRAGQDRQQGRQS
ncbi:MAG TPA: Holliday junction resolvase RuvX [Ornithinimicrobium sp.]|uniref:Holliday junction resolvase RuvX n=1 Tax=Ornithinimicrobium sp. TaxID=1977084 RepID=UPI002B4591F2|nr:Holliday junction resolvase RuvX [Ornithinimicrobium sp.]HKJ11903.1 Holliday junction resolvase RuvX [Ornithinimicrobium sp.]